MTPLCTGICWVLVTATAGNAAADKLDLKAEVQAIYDQIGKAIEKKDIDGVTRFSLPDAKVRYADDKELTLKEWKERAQKGWTAIKKTKSRFQVAEVKPAGETAVASYAETHEILMVDPTDGKEHKINYQGKWRATLKKTADGWRLSRSEELERRVTRDGVLIDQLPKGKERPASRPPARREITAADKKAFLDLLPRLETRGEFFTEESVKKVLPQTGVLLALTAQDIGDRQIYPFLTLVSQLAEHQEARACAARRFAAIPHPTLKLTWAVQLFATEEASDAVVKYLKEVVNSAEPAKELSLVLGPGFEDFKKQVNSAKIQERE